MVTKKIRTEYMKKFKDPRWETFSKCYEDALKYRLTRRVMEHSHKPWFWEGWEGGSESSGRSTPRLTRNKVSPLSPLSLPPAPASSDLKQRLSELKTGPGPEPPHQEAGAGGAGDAAPSTAALVENDVNEAGGGSVKPVLKTSPPSEDTGTDAGPADTASSDGEPVNPPPKRRHRRHAPHTDPGRQDSSSDDKQAEVRKAPRAKSQPPVSTKENRRASSRLDRAEENRRASSRLDRAEENQRASSLLDRTEENRRASSRLDRAETRPEVRTTANDSQSRRESDKRSSNVERRRARSADLDKVRRAQLTVVDDRWMTEYMSCFSARRR
ncbi:centriole, cilia and spindle-associated protein [Platichthys flesus]|uniref:centriole, cilia and spindle-associated protein n=1 Tax=Platichthys flesus TaxID=8260 RepID=UPI002DB7B1D6|nr:centriole, cilia and spindle-associated protein [Platichthys flesus]